VTDDELQALEARLGHAFADPSRVRLALTHRSSVAKQGEHNETLEFLGDSVLGLAISELLLRAWPEASEGQLSKRRAALVNEASLAAKAERIDLGPLIQLGRGEEKTGGRQKRSILADAYEALLGAVFLDAGFLAAQAVVARDFAEDVVQPPVADTEAKTQLQELTQRLFRAPPEYTLLRATGPDHAKDFETNVAVAGRVLGQGRGGSKKIAEQAAAREALAALEGFAPGDALPDVGTPAGDDA